MDIQLTRTLHIGMFKGISIEGKKWLLENIGEDPATVQEAYIDELKEDIERTGLRVERDHD